MNRHILIILLFLSVQLVGQNTSFDKYISCIDTLQIKSLPNMDQDLRNSRIVLIGEAGHGDGRTFELKGELIKYLVEHHGFNTIAFEGAGFIETPHGLNSIKNDSNIFNEFEKFLDPKWSKSNQLKETILYLSKKYKENKVDIFGFDSQPNSTVYTDKLFDLLADNTFKCLTNLDNPVFKLYLKNLKAYYKQSTGQEEFTLTMSEINSLDSLTQIYIKSVSKDCDLLRQTFLNLESNIKLMIYNMEEMGYSDRSVNSRDSVMALNIIYYLDKNPKAKMIITAANFHIIKDLSLITNNYDSLKYKRIVPMGKYLADKYGNSCYSIAITNGGGKNGYCTDTTIYDILQTARFPIEKNTLEYRFKENKCEIVYLNNLLNKQLNNIQTRSLIFGGNMHYGYWNKAFDCIIYIDKQRPSTLRQ
jgi:erythromycin esterase